MDTAKEILDVLHEIRKLNQEHLDIEKSRQRSFSILGSKIIGMEGTLSQILAIMKEMKMKKSGDSGGLYLGGDNPDSGKREC